MEEKRNFYQVVEEICAQDSRYEPDSYEFVMRALKFTQGKLKKQGHITGRELSRGMRDFAVDQYGPMAKTVLNHWGIYTTQDLGNIVFNMVDRTLLSKTEKDSISDFEGIYDFSAAFANVLREQIAKEIK